MKKKKGKICEYVKANRKGSREAELELSVGWRSTTRVHKSKKQYDRKGWNWKGDSDLFPFIYLWFFLGGGRSGGLCLPALRGV
jgi:hypothetical protein